MICVRAVHVYLCAQNSYTEYCDLNPRAGLTLYARARLKINFLWHGLFMLRRARCGAETFAFVKCTCSLHVGNFVLQALNLSTTGWGTFSAPAVPYMWVILCPRRVASTTQRLAPPARARKRSDVTRGHMWATPAPAVHTTFMN